MSSAPLPTYNSKFRNFWIREIPRPGADGLEGPNVSRETEKGNLQQLLNAYNTLERYKILGKDFAPRQATETFVKTKGIELKLK